MTRRSTMQHTLAATLAASVLAASPALAKPADAVHRSGDVRTSSLAGTSTPRQDLRMPDTQDAARPQVQPGQPTWPANPEPLTRPATPAQAPADGGGESIWLLLGIGLG
ncbi:MAG: hypothetical protein ACRDK0_07720, partial [Solirubrobacteraceae bacterium]